MGKLRLVLLILIFSISAFAQQPEAKSEEEKPETQPKARISKIKQFLAPFEYDRDRVRDPFEAQANNAPLRPGQVYGPFLKSQNYRLAEYKLKGLLWKTKNPVALFRSPDGAEFRLRIKDYIGENFGYIASIRENEVVVIQTIEENNRRYSTTKVVFLEK